ncbi:MAG: dihydrodipicolinate reductase [Pseudomonadota bacterium]
MSAFSASRMFLGLAIMALAAPVAAMEKIDQREVFIDALDGRDLTIRLYALTLTVTDDGNITGRAAGRDVTGDWKWEDGYFCRQMMWGSREIPYNCQLVELEGDRMRFTTDRGTGDNAVFRMR